MHDPKGRAAAALYATQATTTDLTHKQVTAALLQGASPALTSAVHLYQRGIAGRTHTEQQLLRTLDALTSDTVAHNTPWHLHRAQELVHHIDWALRKTRQLNNPKDPTP